MSSLHILSEHSVEQLTACLNILGDGDELLFTQQAVYLCQQRHELLANRNCYLLSEDCIARGMVERIDAHFKPIDYPTFVTLTLKHHNSISW